MLLGLTALWTTSLPVMPWSIMSSNLLQHKRLTSTTIVDYSSRFTQASPSLGIAGINKLITKGSSISA